MGKLERKFFERPTLKVAENLLGKFLVRKIGGKKIAMLITETEAYIGEKDLASHARFGRTKRSEIMYGHPGFWYVYLIYGMYEMLNVITEPENHPAAVLIRAGILEQGKLLGGPGKLTKVLKIGRQFNGADALRGNLYIEDRGMRPKPKQIKKTPRIGVDYAGKWKDKKWRFVFTPNE